MSIEPGYNPRDNHSYLDHSPRRDGYSPPRSERDFYEINQRQYELNERMSASRDIALQREPDNHYYPSRNDRDAYREHERQQALNDRLSASSDAARNSMIASAISRDRRVAAFELGRAAYEATSGFVNDRLDNNPDLRAECQFVRDTTDSYDSNDPPGCMIC